MIKTILLMSLLLMALVVTRQAKAQMQQIYAALKEQIFEKACQKEAGLSQYSRISIMTKCPIAMNKMANGTQLLNECEAKLHLTMDNWIQGDLEKC